MAKIRRISKKGSGLGKPGKPPSLKDLIPKRLPYVPGDVMSPGEWRNLQRVPFKKGRGKTNDPKEQLIPPGRGVRVPLKPKKQKPPRTTKPRPGGGAPPPGTAPPPPFPGWDVLAANQVNPIYAPVLGEYAKLIAELRAETAAQARAKQEAFRLFAEHYGQTAPKQIENTYRQVAADQNYFAKGFSEGMTLAQRELASGANKQIEIAGGGPDQLIHVGPEGANVAYGLGGVIPASVLQQQGAAFASAAALQPPALMAEGARLASEIEKAGATDVAKLRMEVAQLQTQKRAAIFELSQKLRESGQKAKADRLDSLQKRADKLTSQTGWLYIVNKKGTGLIKTKVRTLEGQKFDLDAADTVADAMGKPPTTKTVAGVGLVQWDPKTGQWFVAMPAQTGGAGGGKAKTYKTPNGDIIAVTQFPDGSFGIQTIWKAPGKPKFTAKELRDAKRLAGETAREAFYGIYDEENGTWKSAPKTYQQVMLDLLQAGVPLGIAQQALNRFWKKPGFDYDVKRRIDSNGEGFAIEPDGWIKSGSGRPTRPYQARAPQRQKIAKLEALAMLWVQAGGRPEDAYTAAAIAMGESGANPRVRNNSSIEDSRGLWQINTRAHPWTKGMNLYDPLTNARAAVRVYNNSKSFNPWTVYKTGAYQKYLPANAGTPVSATTDGSLPPPTKKLGPGNWYGSQRVAKWIADIGLSQGLTVSSAKRNRRNTASGGISDHWRGKKNGYAYDISGSVPEMDNAIASILRSLGITDVHYPVEINLRRNGYRIQILYRTMTGGNHYDHIHIGVLYEG